MSKYELDLTDTDVRELISDLADIPAGPWSSVISALREQIPIPVPTKIGAVVRDQNTALFVRVTEDTDHEMEWWNSSEGVWVGTESLPKIAAVLSEGVDL